MSPHYLVKNNSSDAACRIVEHKHNTSIDTFSQSHPLTTGVQGKTIIISVN